MDVKSFVKGFFETPQYRRNNRKCFNSYFSAFLFNTSNELCK